MPCSSIEPASALTCSASSARTFSGTRISIERDLAPGLAGWWWPSGPPVGLGPAPLAGRSPATRTPARACHPRVAGRPVSGRRPSGLKPVAVATEVQRAQLLAGLADQVAFADRGSRRRTRCSASLSVPSLQRATARRVPRDPSGRSSKRTTSVTVGLVSGALTRRAYPRRHVESVRAWTCSWSSVVGRVGGADEHRSAGSRRLPSSRGAHRLVAGEHGAQRVDGGVAELGGDGEQVVHARRLAGLAALDVAADERGDREVLLGQLGSRSAGSGWWRSIIARAPRSSASRQHGPAAGIASQSRGLLEVVGDDRLELGHRGQLALDDVAAAARRGPGGRRAARRRGRAGRGSRARRR